jgi:pimeloyl-ACP methyl ester carboxylesterase
MRPGVKKRLIVYPIATCALYLTSCLLLANFYVKPSRTVPRTPEQLCDVTIPTAAGTDPAWATPALAAGHPKGKVVFVLAHGYGGTRAAWRGVIEKLEAAGCDAVDPALPGQDASPDKTVGFGLKEAQVLVDSVHWACRRYPKDHPPKVILLGVSMGGAACWLASEQIPNEVDAVISEGAYARFDQTMNRWFDDIVPDGNVVMHPVALIASYIGGVDPAAIRPVDAAAEWRKPALVIQAGADKLILRDNADRLAKAANCPLWLVPNAVHANCYVADEKGYMAHILGVVSQVEGRS